MKKTDLDMAFKQFQIKYMETLLKWLKLAKLQQDNLALSPSSRTFNGRINAYTQEQYLNSVKHNENLSKFEKTVDKNILATYLKYVDDKTLQVTLPFSWSYDKPKRDLVIKPYQE